MSRKAAKQAPPPPPAIIEHVEDQRETPPDIFDPLHEEWGFTIDIAAGPINHKVPRYCAIDGFHDASDGTFKPGLDGLTFALHPWEQVFCNQPFSEIQPKPRKPDAPWIQRAWQTPATWVMLLPQNRQEQPFWQHWIEEYRDKGEDETVPSHTPGCIPARFSTRNLPWRRHFLCNGGEPILNEKTGKRSSAQFGILVLVWDRRHRR